MKILLTGHTGFIGSSFMDDYKDEYDILGISMSKTDYRTLELAKFDCVLHTSALVHDKNETDPVKYFKINVDQTISLARHAKEKGVKHFIFISSSSVYGVSDKEIENCAIKENAICQPDSAYGESKLQAELELKKLGDQTFKISIIRCPLVYGENCKGNMRSLVNLVSRSPILPFLNETNLRSFIYIKNFTYFLKLVLEKSPGGTFIPQDTQPITIEYLIKLIGRFQRRRNILVPMPSFLKFILSKVKKSIIKKLYSNFYFDSTLTNSILSYSPIYSTDEGVRRMVESKL